MAVVACSGIREVDRRRGAPLVELTVAEVLPRAEAMLFGGALGSDTMALRAAHALRRPRGPRLIVVLPSRLRDQPREAQAAVEECADEIVELGLKPGATPSYMRRNDALVERADVLLAFTDGRSSGGTAYTISKAKREGIETIVVAVPSVRPNPRYTPSRAPSSIHTMYPYVSTQTDAWQSDLPTRTILRLKAYQDPGRDLDQLAQAMADYIASHRELSRPGTKLVPVPRRQPGEPSDLMPLLERVSDLTGQPVVEDWLVRDEVPTRGAFVAGRRLRFPEDEHARTMSVEEQRRPSGPAGVVIVDNVLSTGGTAIGAQQAVMRDAGYAAPVLAVLEGDLWGERPTP
ncbi:MAG TPA: hypothetical protein VFH61_13780 [Thermoleophilia bacterium]|nr:hypothetical protein [Thermoleophilia bacterium]